MKKLLAMLLVFSLIAAFAACAKKPAETDGTTAPGAQDTAAGTEAPADEETETVVDADEAFAPEALIPGEYPAVTYGRITCIEAPAGWHIGDESADWRIVYVQDDETASIQLTTDEDTPEQLFKRVTELREENGETYASEEITVAGIPFTVMFPDLGLPAMYGSVDGQTLVVTFSKEVDIHSQVFTDIVGNVHIAPEE